MRDFIHLLPSSRGLQRDLTLSEADDNFVNPCRDIKNGNEVYKLLTRESVMLTYEKVGDKLVYVDSSPLHDVA